MNFDRKYASVVASLRTNFVFLSFAKSDLCSGLFCVFPPEPTRVPLVTIALGDNPEAEYVWVTGLLAKVPTVFMGSGNIR